MEREPQFDFKRRFYGDLEISRRSNDISGFEGRFEADFKTWTLILPLKREIIRFSWIVESISHEYLHFIVTELENASVGGALDNLGYNLATGYESEGD